MTASMDAITLWPQDAPEVAGSLPDGIPMLKPYLPESAVPTGAIVVCPGGGYQRRADHEGEPVAHWLNTLDIAAFVVDYRVAPHRHPLPLLDAQRAIRTVRANSGRWNVDPQRVGILGFSAGGHLAATVATQWDGGEPHQADPIARVSCRPDVAILCYPVISFMHASHTGSMTNLLGETPPAFLWHTADDDVVDVENSLLFASALRRHGVPFALHVFPSGAHGLGLAEDHPEAAIWTGLCARFLQRTGFAT